MKSSMRTAYTRLTQEKLRKLEIPVQPRKYIMKCCEDLRRGLLTFEYLERRILAPLKKKSSSKTPDKKKAAAAKSKK